MQRAPMRLTDAEFAVLEVLWEGGAQTIRQMTAKLYPKATVSDYATVQKLLERLEDKGCATRDRSGFAHVFRAAKQREDLIDSQLREMAEKLCNGSLTPVLMHLVERTSLTKQHHQMLRDMLDKKNRKRQA